MFRPELLPFLGGEIKYVTQNNTVVKSGVG